MTNPTLPSPSSEAPQERKAVDPTSWRDIALAKCYAIERYPAEPAQTHASLIASAALHITETGGDYAVGDVEALHRAAEFLVQDYSALRRVAEARQKDYEAAAGTVRSLTSALEDVIQRLESHTDLDARDRRAIRKANTVLPLFATPSSVSTSEQLKDTLDSMTRTAGTTVFCVPWKAHRSRISELEAENERLSGECSGWQDIAESAEKRIASLEANALTAEEATNLRRLIPRGWLEVESAKLRRLATQDQEEK